MLLIVLAIVASGLIYWYCLNSLGTWRRKGVRHIRPVPIFGNFFASFLQRVTFVSYLKKMYDAFPEERYVGLYQFHKPILMLRDPELIKRVYIKDFDNFHDHSVMSSDTDTLWSRNLTSTKGQRWHDLRSTLSPTFTGNKMRAMFVLMQECSQSLTTYFDEKKEDVVTVEMKDLFARFANDVIATCAFGIQCDSLRNRENEFYTRGLEATDFSGLKALKFFGHAISPALMKFFKVTVFSQEIGNFFRGVVRDTIAYRKENGIIRPDMIHLLLEASKNDKYGVMSSQEDITAQVLVFFFAGFDIISTTIVFLTYELAINPDIQERLTADIDNAMAECDGKLTYDALMKIKYLDMVVSESMRRWPGTLLGERVCTKHYTIEPKHPNEQPLEVAPGDSIWIPHYAMHMDPKYFPDPEKFDPERFSDENKEKVDPSTYLPFGAGPRNCIGSRFALMEMKVVIANLLSQFEIVPVKRTTIPVVLSPKHFTLFAKGGMWLGLKRRTAI